MHKQCSTSSDVCAPFGTTNKDSKVAVENHVSHAKLLQMGLVPFLNNESTPEKSTSTETFTVVVSVDTKDAEVLVVTHQENQVFIAVRPVHSGNPCHRCMQRTLKPG